MTITETEKIKLVRKALRILRKNYGCPGEDGISYKLIKKEPLFHFSEITKKFEEILNGEKQFSKPRKIDIIDAHRRERTIYVYNIYDRIIQQCIRLLINSIVKSNISEKVLSHKKGIDLSKKVKELLYASENVNVILRLDIENYYLSINKKILFEMLLNIGISKVLVSTIEASFLHCEQGIPVGNCLSPILSDFYLMSIDSLFEKDYARFSDDMFFSIKHSRDADLFIEKITSTLANLHLRLNESKTLLIYDRNIEGIL